jgi:hypothetical protein
MAYFTVKVDISIQMAPTTRAAGMGTRCMGKDCMSTLMASGGKAHFSMECMTLAEVMLVYVHRKEFEKTYEFIQQQRFLYILRKAHMIENTPAINLYIRCAHLIRFIFYIT